jgi:hypothetical protein
MTIYRTVFAATLFTTVALLPTTQAQDVPPVVQAIFKSWEAQYKIKPEYKTISADGSSITVDGISATIPVEDAPGSSVKMGVGKLELQNVSDQGNGLFEVGTATYSDLKIEVVSAGLNFSAAMPKGQAEGWYVKALGDNPTPGETFRATMNVSRKATTGPISINVMGQTITSDGAQSTWDGDPLTGSGKTSIKLSNLHVPEAAIAAVDQSGALKQLGYPSLTFDLGGDGTINNDNANFGMDFDGYFAAKDMGTLKMGMAVNGVPVELIQKLKETEPGKEPDFTAFLPQIQGISFGRLLVRFEDSSITKKLLPMAAAMQGMDEKTLVANAGAMLQLGLAELKNPAFTEQVVKAVTAYLQDPKSITISLRPAAPVPVQQLMALDPANPGAAINTLGVSVTAND